MTKEKTNIKSILIIISISLLVIIASCFLCVKLLIKSNDNAIPPPGSSPIGNAPTLSVATEINVYVADHTTKFLYTVQNLGEYKVSCFTANLNIAELDGNIIKPKTVGTTKIITTINTIPLIKKETILNVLPVVTDVSLQITNNNGDGVSEFYTDTKYNLIVTENIETNLVSEILYSDNIIEFTFIKKENLTSYYTFEISETGNFELRYKNIYYQEWINFSAKKMPTDFIVNFTNNKLYLFDINYLSLANYNNFFNNTYFEILIQDNTDDIVELIEYDKSIIDVIDNKIIAKNVGKTKLKFISKISHIEKEYEIVIEEVLLNKILINSIEYDLNSIINIDINKNETIDFSFCKSPSYCNDILSIDYNEEEVNYLNEELSLINGATGSIIYIKNKLGTIVTTINLKIIETYKIEVNLSNQNYLDVTLNNKELNVNFQKDEYISLEVYLINEITNNKESSQTFNVIIENVEICELEDKIINGVVNLKIKANGITTIKIVCENFDVELVLAIKIF